jgi:NAD(P)H dehydrogenase (quinone)
MILVTGATGHLGGATVDFLLQTIPAAQIAVLARDENKAAALKEKGIAVRIGNYKDYNSLVAAFAGIDKVLLVSSADMDDRFKQHKNAIDAAKEAGVKHVIYTSSDIKDITNSATGDIADVHNRTAQYLKMSGLSYTLLNNNLYADVLPMFLGEKVLETGVYFPGGEGKVPFATRSDMAEAAAQVLTTDLHENKEYAIAGDVAYSFGDIAQLLSEISGKEITYTSPTSDEFKQALSVAGVPEFFVGMLADFAKAIKDTEFDTQNSDLEKLIGRKPTSLKEYLRRVYSAQ